ncbi:MAG TPA: hypothetical protein VHP34_10180, partial [Alphaproteobacteria bacterium]|nr:hypothetical protein [Alphaproteobacteria bacterium]
NILGVSSPDRPRMVKGLKQSSLAYEYIIMIDGYSDWFEDFKDKRDLVKLGQHFFICGPESNLGIGFSLGTSEGGLVIDVKSKYTYRLTDLMKAIKFSEMLLDKIAEVFYEKTLQN